MADLKVITRTGQERRPLLAIQPKIDHLIIGAATLEQGVAYVDDPYLNRQAFI